MILARPARQCTEDSKGRLRGVAAGLWSLLAGLEWAPRGLGPGDWRRAGLLAAHSSRFCSVLLCCSGDPLAGWRLKGCCFGGAGRGAGHTAGFESY